MKAVVCHQYGLPDSLHVEDITTPQPRPGEVLVSVKAAGVNFPDALIMLSPFGAVLDTLMASKLDRLDDVAKDIRTSLAQVKFGAGGGGGQQKLSAGDYQRLFDPGFVQVIAVDPQKAIAAWNTPPNRLALDVKDSLGRIGNKLPDPVKQRARKLLSH